MPRKHTNAKHQPYQQPASCKQKQPYASEKDALDAIEYRSLMDMNLVELSTYQCSSCSKWHLTRRKRLV